MPYDPSTHRVIIVRASRKAAVLSFLHNHPQLDPMGGGDQSFAVRLALLGDPDDASVVRGYAVGWSLSDAHWILLRAWFVDHVENWKVNTSDSDNDVSHYNTANWTYAQIKADTTRKPFAVKVVPVE